jgi:hypothetical protein
MSFLRTVQELAILLLQKRDLFVAQQIFGVTLQQALFLLWGWEKRLLLEVR